MIRSGIYYWMLLWLVWAPGLRAADFIIHEVQLEEHQGQILLSLQIDYHLSKVALEALSNGVPLTLELKLRVEPVWGSFWQQRPLEASIQHQIRYHALTDLYRVTDLQSGAANNFVTQDAALYALGEYTKIPLVMQEQLNPATDYNLRLRADLDIESLPLPLRPLAYFHRGWKLSSGWTQWPLRP
jgi:hypothetical protein